MPVTEANIRAAAQAGNSLEVKRLRATAVLEALGGSLVLRRPGGRRLVLTNITSVTNPQGVVVGWECTAEYTIGGVAQDIDPHRQFVNPPTSVVDAEAVVDGDGNEVTPRALRFAPSEALEACIWQQIDEHPR